MRNQALSAWRYRHFIYAAVRGEILGRFARSKVGALWMVLNPLAQATIFALVLSKVLAAKLPGMTGEAAYAMYLMAGMAAWSLFGEILGRSLTIFIDYAATMKKIAFPRICLPLIVLGVALVNHVLLLGAIAFVFLFFGAFPTWYWLLLPLGAVLVAGLAFGIGIFLGVLNVFMRDVGQVMGVVLQMWFWLTPIVYVTSILPAPMQTLVALNPMTPLVALYQNALVFGRGPDWGPLLTTCALAAGFAVLAALVFRRAGPDLVDAL